MVTPYDFVQTQKLELPVHTKCVEPCESTAEEVSFEW